MLNTLRTLALRIIFLAALLYPLAVASRTAQAQTNANAQFVTANYFAVRGRTPDWTGWNFWYYALASGEVNDACVSSSTVCCRAWLRIRRARRCLARWCATCPPRRLPRSCRRAPRPRTS